ncbi:MAG TPA: tyrosine-type recombinase/integrase [Solirubrobacterales bacterium]
MGHPPHQTPYKRTYANGKIVWIARYCDLDKRVRYAKPRWNGRKATFARRADAQRAIDEALGALYGTASRPRKLGEFAELWFRRYPRSKRTNSTNAGRLSSALEVELEGRPLAEWQFDELHRRQVLELVDYMLRVEGRAARGARGILSTLSAMSEDAIAEEAASANAFKGVRIRASDPRITKRPRRTRIWSFEQMLAFAAGGRPEVRAATRRPPGPRNRGRGRACYFTPHDYEALILTPGFTGLRLGEVLALEVQDFDGRSLSIARTAHHGDLIESSRQKNHERIVPVPPTLARMIEGAPRRPGCDLLFPTPRGRLWREENFYRDVWIPAKLASGMDPTPHEFRHSYVSNLRAGGIDDADLAEVAGHTVETMIAVYTHPLRRSHEEIRQLIG